MPGTVSIKTGLTALHEAVRCGHLEVVKELIIAAGANIDQTDNNGETPLQLAARCNKLEILPALLQAGADPNAKNSETSQTALHEAAELGHLEVIKALIAKKAHINQTDNDGNTPFHLAAIRGKFAVFPALLQAGADPNAKNSKTGLTALHKAVELGLLEVVKALIAKRADINQTDNDGNTPLHTALNITFSSLHWSVERECADPQALEKKIENIVKLLTEQPEINLNLENNRGETPLSIATQRFTDEGCIARTLKQCAAKQKALEGQGGSDAS